MKISIIQFVLRASALLFALFLSSFNYPSLGQNLLINGDFENVINKVGDYRIRQDSFYALNWHRSTDCTVDIYRDYGACDSIHIKAFEPQLDFCVSTKSGDYCIGMYLINYFGYSEYITGRFSNPLEKNKVYRIDFYLRYLNTSNPRASFGFGYKLSEDSIIFSTSIYDIDGLSSFYNDLYGKLKIYADFELDYPFIDTSWTKIESYYKAKGGERFITFGKFCYRNDDKIMKQFDYLRHHPNEIYDRKFLNKEKSLVIKKVNVPKTGNTPDLLNYYFLDLIEVVQIDSIPDTFRKEKSNTEFKDHLRNNIPIEAFNYIDLDPLTPYPDRREIIIDKGFEGKMTLELGIRLRPMEKYVLEYGKKCSLVIVNTGEDNDGYSEMVYTLKYPARKLRKKPVKFFVEKIYVEEIEELRKKYKKVKVIDTDSFHGLLFKK